MSDGSMHLLCIRLICTPFIGLVYTVVHVLRGISKGKGVDYIPLMMRTMLVFLVLMPVFMFVLMLRLFPV